MKLKEKRLQAGLSQSQLAKLSGVALKTLQKYEQGVFKLSNYEKMQKLAAALNCDIKDLV
jgi:transcriptional regulator with XRE-family HTH domain